jgi:hypothetical protein
VSALGQGVEVESHRRGRSSLKQRGDREIYRDAGGGEKKKEAR